MSNIDPEAPIHPGNDLAEIIGELEISPQQLAETIGVPAETINKVLDGRHPITGDLALRIGKTLWMSPEFWMNLQKMYEMDVARISTDTSFIVPLVPEPEDDFLLSPVSEDSI